jgi:hypothetical protein
MGQDWKFSAAVTGLTSLCFQNGLSVTLREIAKRHDNKAGPWLDKIRKEVVDGATGSDIEGVDQETLVKALKTTKAVLNHFFDEFSLSLSNSAKDKPYK